MTAYNVVHYRVKPGKEQEFVDTQVSLDRSGIKGFRKGVAIKSGELRYCFIGEWDSMEELVAARPRMIGNLDKVRHLLEDFGDGKGVTEAVAGEVVWRSTE